MKSVLVLYVSRRGHTARVARTICESIAASGGWAEMMEVREAVHEGGGGPDTTWSRSEPR
jgi:menaquinone-dependent protoporphyrinogen oxidase